MVIGIKLYRVTFSYASTLATEYLQCYTCDRILHDDFIKWQHFLRYWPFVRGIHRSPVNSPHKGQWRGVLMFSLICVWINGWVNNRGAGDLRHYRAHYDVIVIKRNYQHTGPVHYTPAHWIRSQTIISWITPRSSRFETVFIQNISWLLYCFSEKSRWHFRIVWIAEQLHNGAYNYIELFTFTPYINDITEKYNIPSGC